MTATVEQYLPINRAAIDRALDNASPYEIATAEYWECACHAHEIHEATKATCGRCGTEQGELKDVTLSRLNYKGIWHNWYRPEHYPSFTHKNWAWHPTKDRTDFHAVLEELGLVYLTENSEDTPDFVNNYNDQTRSLLFARKDAQGRLDKAFITIQADNVQYWKKDAESGFLIACTDKEYFARDKEEINITE